MIEVEKGMADGDTIVFAKEGEQIPDMIPGDVIFTIKQTPHNKFKRVGDNLYVDLDITLEEALLGFKKRINHLDGHLVEISSKVDEIV
jgi:DnaJ-class molecular chaperone